MRLEVLLLFPTNLCVLTMVVEIVLEEMLLNACHVL